MTKFVDGYSSPLNIIETEDAIKCLRIFFEQHMAKNLNLSRVSAPLFVEPSSGLNDNLNGIESPVSFGIKDCEKCAEIVHSLAKWKRYALAKYGYSAGQGIYTNMNAIRAEEICDNTHSIYVDQWDWEKIILPDDRNLDFLYDTVRKIYAAVVATEDFVCQKYGLDSFLPKNVIFLTAQQMEDELPHNTPQEREYHFAKKHGAIFVAGIGSPLKSGQPHDGRAPDYDDWSLNGDIIVYYPLLDIPLELSSMGIRVDEVSLKGQLEATGCSERLELPFHRAISEKRLPYTIGGGIGQSRLSMLLLQKLHIGEVQVSIWPNQILEECAKRKINLL